MLRKRPGANSDLDLVQTLAFCSALSGAAPAGFCFDTGVNSRHLGATLPHHAAHGRCAHTLPKWQAHRAGNGLLVPLGFAGVCHRGMGFGMGQNLHLGARFGAHRRRFKNQHVSTFTEVIVRVLWGSPNR